MKPSCCTRQFWDKSDSLPQIQKYTCPLHPESFYQSCFGRSSSDLKASALFGLRFCLSSPEYRGTRLPTSIQCIQTAMLYVSPPPSRHHDLGTEDIPQSNCEQFYVEQLSACITAQTGECISRPVNPNSLFVLVLVLKDFCSTVSHPNNARLAQ